MNVREQKLLAMVDGLQEALRDLAHTFTAVVLSEAGPDSPEIWTQQVDRAEILGNWDVDDERPEDGYEVLFTTCDGCERMTIPVIEGLAEVYCRWCEDPSLP